jgi:chromate transporter
LAGRRADRADAPRELVEERGWISEEQYLHALNFCHLLPGPEAQQLAIWIGWKLHGIRGGLAAGLLFVIPGALVILALDALWRGGASGVVCRAVSGHQGGGAGHCGAGGAAPCGRALGTIFARARRWCPSSRCSCSTRPFRWW